MDRVCRVAQAPRTSGGRENRAASKTGDAVEENRHRVREPTAGLSRNRMTFGACRPSECPADNVRYAGRFTVTLEPCGDGKEAEIWACLLRAAAGGRKGAGII